MGKRFFILTVGLLGAAMAVSAEHVELANHATNADVTVIVEESSDYRTVVRFEIGAYDRHEVNIDDQTHFQIECGREGNLLIAGEPALPRLCRSIIIPDDAAMSIKVLSAKYTDFAETPVVPSKGSLPRTVNPEDVPYKFGPVYSGHEWYPGTLAELREPYILRDYRGTVIELNAFQYNPGTRTLRVFTSVTVEVVSEGPGKVNVIDGSRKSRMRTPDFELIYSCRFVNYAPPDGRYTLVGETGDMLVITYDGFHDAIMPLVNWKNQKGIKTTVVDVSTIGNNSALIANFIQEFYDSTNLAFVLLVGDNAQIATLTSGGGGADPMYALVDGSDSYPDIFIGRFSAETVEHVQTQVERTIAYELNSPGYDWYHKATGIASTEGPGHHGEYDNEHMGYIRDDLLAYNYTEVDEFYGTGATSSQVTTALNGGRGFVNYCGHGGTTSWSTTGFNNTNVNALVNDHMLPFIISVACLNGKFRYTTCFGEAWLRATNGDNPTGAIGAYMSSINQDWNPPMDAQDEVTDLLIAELLNSYGGLCFNGSCYMIEVNGSSGINMFNTWHIFGDPSVQVRTDNPATMTVNHAGAAFFNLPEYEVEVVGVEGALCALSKDGVLYGSAYSGPDGIATIPLAEALPIGELLTLTVTAYNKITFVDDVVVTTDLAIIHDPLPDTKDTINDYEVVCTIFSEVPLVADSVLLWYEINSIWSVEVLEPVRLGEDYIGYIPAQTPGTVINYYLFAKNEGGFVDSTETFSFRVIDYGVLLEPEFLTQMAPVDDTVWYALTVINDGVLSDDYVLTASGYTWSTSLWDETGVTPVSGTPTLFADETFGFLVRVIVPASFEDEYDTVEVVATSNANGSISDAAILKTVSAGQPWPIPFTEEFPTVDLDMNKWELAAGIAVNGIGINEPSEPYSADLNGSPYSGDTLISEKINLRGESNVLLKYYYQRTGGGDSPESGDDLFVEYLDSLGNWHLLAQYDGSGEDMTEYEFVEMTLPAGAYHSGFRLCFRNSASSGAYDDWFIDDVYVGYPSDYDVSLEPYSQSQFGPAGDSACYLVTIYNTGLLADAYNLSCSDNNWDVSFFDKSGQTEITSTSSVPSNDSLKVMAKVAIPSSALPYETDTASITATSQGDGNVSATVLIMTSSGGLPVAFPVFEPFAEVTLSVERWFANYGAEITVDGLAPPSAPYSLCLDGGIDTIVSRLIDLSDEEGAILSYYYERGGSGSPPSVGENLWVDYKNVYGEWVNISTHLGGDPSMTTFEHVNNDLPVDAIHSGFQLRLRSYGSGEDNDKWFVDDIRVDYAPDISVTPGLFSETILVGDSGTIELVIGNAGAGGLTYAIAVQQALTKRSSFHDLLETGLVEPATRSYPQEFYDYVDEKGVDNPNRGLPVNCDAGGPDLFGYYWIDSDEPGGPGFAWEDVSAIGVDIVGDLDDDTCSGPYDLGFDFPYYGNVYSQIYVGSNGIVGFTPTDMRSRLKTPLPTAATPNNIIAWLWDDLDPTNVNNTTAHVYTHTTGDQFVIQFVDYPEYGASAGDVVTAEVILYSDGGIKFQYLSIAPGFDAASCAIGLENADGTDGLEVALETSYLHDNLAIMFVNPYQWLTLDKSAGEVAPGAADVVLGKLTTAELEIGIYNADIIITSNDPDTLKNPITVPVELTVTDEPPYICGDADGSGEPVDIADLVYFVMWLFNDGPPPPIIEAVDMDGSGGESDIADLVYMVIYMFQDGPPLVCGT